jgi:hypothetical protein
MDEWDPSQLVSCEDEPDEISESVKRVINDGGCVFAYLHIYDPSSIFNFPVCTYGVLAYPNGTYGVLTNDGDTITYSSWDTFKGSLDEYQSVANLIDIYTTNEISVDNPVTFCMYKYSPDEGCV